MKNRVRFAPLVWWTTALFLLSVLALPPTARAADVPLSGVVSDESGQGLPGVNVLVKGTAVGATTDARGRYSLRVPAGRTTLVFSFVGYVTQEVELGGRSVLDLTLRPDEQSLNEVVVVGYGVQKKRDLTGAISTVSSKQIQAVPVTNVVQALQGRAAGVDVANTSYSPGDSPRIRIRGNRSFTASNEPLYVVDGVPLAGGSLNDFNPGDIESLEVLKDASATAIYGSRGANGVVLITTKRGKAGKTTVSYDAFYGVQFPSQKLQLYDGAGYAELTRESYRNRLTGFIYKSPTPNFLEDSILFAPKDFYMWQSVRQAYDPDGTYHPERVRSTNWPDQVLQQSALQSHQVSVAGGGEKTRFLLSAGLFSDKGIMKGKDFNRYTTRFNLDHEISKRVRVGFSNTFAYSIQNQGQNLYYQAHRLLPLTVPRDTLGRLLLNPGNDANTYNILLDIEGVKREQRNTRFFGSFYGEVDLLKGLKFRVNFGPDFSLTRNGLFYAAQSSEGKGGSSTAGYNQTNRFAYTLENLLFYNARFADKHELGVTLLQSAQEERVEGSSGTVTNLPYETQLFYNLGTGQNVTGIGSDFSRWRLLSYMGRVNYNFKNKYYLTLTGRVDGSSRLAEGNKYSFFPSVSVAYNLSEEAFLRDVPFIAELKLRGGYGETGNTSISPYQTQGSLARTTYSWDEIPAYGYRPGSIVNSALRWERTAALNIGLDFSLWRSRVSGSVNVYESNTYDLLLRDQLPTAGGYDNYLRNVGSTRNTGIELNLSTTNVRTAGGFQWSTDWMFTRNREAITELYKGKVDDLGNGWFIGQPLSVVYDYKIERIWQNTPEDLALLAEFNKKGNNGFRPGDIKPVDVNGDGIINPADRTILGTDRPAWIASLTNTISYKGLELSVFAYTRQKYLLSADIYGLSYFLNDRVNQVVVDYWTPSNPTGTFPRPSERAFPLYSNSMKAVDGSFVRIRTATLAYTFPSALTERLKLNRLRAYVTADNPFIFNRDKQVLDPEGAGAANTPNRTAFLFGLNVGL
jgi:TonB-linked SusC/RagA family outer membrane protein